MSNVYIFSKYGKKKEEDSIFEYFRKFDRETFIVHITKVEGEKFFKCTINFREGNLKLTAKTGTTPFKSLAKACYFARILIKSTKSIEVNEPEFNKLRRYKPFRLY